MFCGGTLLFCGGCVQLSGFVDTLLYKSTLITDTGGLLQQICTVNVTTLWNICSVWRQPVTEHVWAASEESSFQTVMNITRRHCGVSCDSATVYKCHEITYINYKLCGLIKFCTLKLSSDSPYFWIFVYYSGAFLLGSLVLSCPPQIHFLFTVSAFITQVRQCVWFYMAL